MAPRIDLTGVRELRKNKHTDTQGNWDVETWISDGETWNLSVFIVHSWTGRQGFCIQIEKEGLLNTYA